MKQIFLPLMLLLTLCAWADVAQQARETIDAGDYAGAIRMLRSELETPASASSAGVLNALLGEALYRADRSDEALAPLAIADKKGVADASRWLGRIAAESYDFTSAASHFNRYVSLRQKAGGIIDPDVESEKESAALAASQMQRVQQLVVIDSIVIPKKDFFASYRLPQSSGALVSAGKIPFQEGRDEARMAFISGDGDMMMWAQSDSLGVSRLVESIRLTGGEWQEPQYTDSVINIGSAEFPFMMSDGITLYFAAKGDRSIGGYDIFVASRNPMDNTYRLPQNLGMPVNSPFDDYMLAIDEENGVGWWATDRNRLGDNLTVYLFIPWEIRETYPEDTPGLEGFARLVSFRDTWPEDTDYESLLEAVSKINPEKEQKEKEFEFRLPDGRLYTSYDDFASAAAANLMEQYLATAITLEDAERELASLRAEYHTAPSRGTASRIVKMETDRDKLITDCNRLRSRVIKAEVAAK